MKTFNFLIAALAMIVLLPGHGISDTLCVRKSARVVNGRVRMKQAVKRVVGDCPKNYLELASTEEFVGASGIQGVQGEKGEQGPRGEPGPLLDVLPAERTLTGVYFLGGFEESMYGYISFPSPLPFQALAHYVRKGEAPPDECPGNSNSPQAAPGNFCVYERTAMNVSSRGTIDFAGAPVVTDEHGVGVWYQAEIAGGFSLLAGTWAVTAPPDP